MLRPHLILLSAAALLVFGACTSPRPVETSEERPSAEEVARSASDAAKEAEGDKLVLYSSSMEKAELEKGVEANEQDATAAGGARAGEGVEDEALPEAVELVVNADATYVLAGETFSQMPALLEALEKRHAQRPAESVQIRAGADASDEAILDAVTAARRAGFTSIALKAVDKAPAETAPTETPTEPAPDTP